MFEPRELHRPYPGLRPFGSDELPLFFGREAHVSRLIDILHRRQFLAVVGPSGAGKSSLVRAGLLPALALGWPGTVSDWRFAVMRPGDRPLRRLAQALLKPDVLGTELGSHDLTRPADDSLPPLIEAELRAGPQALAGLVADAERRRAGQPAFNLLVLVDQFEELFRYAESGERQSDECETFVDLLLAPQNDADADPAARRVHVALTMRTDALHDCARFLDLPEAINHGQYLVPRLKPDELRRAITEPARVFSGQVQPAVVDTLLHDVQRAPDELPMLQHALSRMWDSASRRNDRAPSITADDERDTGGLADALSRHANDIFNGLSADDQVLADGLFRAITGHGNAGKADLRRPQRLDRIARFVGRSETDWPLFEPVLRAFAAEGANFLHFAEPLGPDTVVDISHEALIRQWDRLRALVEWEAALAGDYRRWRDRSEQHRSSSGELLTGADLGAAVAWRSGQGSVGGLVERRGSRISRVLLWINPDALPVGSVADGSSVIRPFAPYAQWAGRYALADGDNAARDEFDALQAFIGRSQQADEERRARAADAEAEQQAARDREAQMLLAAEQQRSEAARERAEAAERERAVASAGKRKATRWLVVAVTVAVLAVMAALTAWRYWQAATVAERKVEAAAQKTQASLVSATTLRLAIEGQAMVAGDRPGGTVRGLMEVLAAHRLEPGAEPTATLQSAAGRIPPQLLKVADAGAAVTAVAFSPDGTRIVSGSQDNTLRLWDAKTGQPIGAPLAGHQDFVSSVAFSPDGTRIVSGSYDNTLQLWDAKTGQPIGAPLAGHQEYVSSVAFSPDGTRIVSGSYDKTLRLWDAKTGQPIGAPLAGHQDAVWSVAFSPNGMRIVSGSRYNTLRLWDAKTRQPIGAPLTGHQSDVLSVAFSPDGTRIVSGSGDKTLRLWDVFEGWADTLCSKLTRNMTLDEWQRWVDDLPYRRQCSDLPGPADEQAMPVAAAAGPASTASPAGRR